MDLDLIRKYIKTYGEQTTLQNLLIILNNSEYLNIYTDGATQFDGKNRKSGIGVYFGDHDERNLSKLVNTKDNNECEIIACIEALKIVINKYNFVNILTDSRLIVDRMNGICRSDKCKELFNELKLIDDNFIDIKYTYVKGHSDIKGNIEADKLSRSLL